MKYKKICKCCGEEFETNNPQKLFCDREHWLPCPVCGKLVKKTDRDFTRPPKCCSPKCSHELAHRSFPKKKCILCGKEFVPNSGVGLVCSDKHTRKCAVCGKEFEITRANRDTQTCSEECRWKLTRATCKEHYGAEYPMQTKVGKHNFHQSMETKYGKKHALQVPEFKQHAMETNLERYGVPYYCVTQDCVDKQTEKSGIISKTNLKFGSNLAMAGIPYKLEHKITTLSYDFEIIDRNILIEINPSFTHNTVDTRYGGVPKNYHLDKSVLAKTYGFRCIHVWDWDNWEKIIALISPKCVIYARNCKLSVIDSKTANEFLTLHHIQGTCRGQTYCFGLYHEGKLVEVMTFGKSRYDKNYDLELLRLCTQSNLSIIGGASKLFTFAKRHLPSTHIISYCDLSKFKGDVYGKLGMELIRQTPPQEIWSKGNESITANLLRQRGFDQLFKTNYGKGTSNEQLMLDHGWLPVYDCGQAVFAYKSN